MPYTEDDYEYDGDALVLNYYGRPVIAPERFMELHRATVPTAAGVPPWCSCGWTRWHDSERRMWIELHEHLDAMGEFADRTPQR